MSSMETTAWRWPALVVIPALLVGLLLVDRATGTESQPVVDTRSAMPLASQTDALGSTWYCAAGTSVDGGAADHSLVLSNPTGRDGRGRLTVYGAPLGAEGTGAEMEAQVVGVEVPAYSQVVRRLGEFEGVQADVTAALVEFDTGGVVVEHQVTGPDGLDRAPCAARSSRTWHLAGGTTRPGAREIIVLFNPFAANAVVDLSFVTDEGIRTPQVFEGVVLPARAVVPLDVTDVVTLFDSVSTSVTARTGRFVAERIQFVRTEVSAVDVVPLVGVDVELGAPRAADEWVFGSPGVAGQSTAIVVYNPGGSEAEVDVDVRLDRPEESGIVEPFELTVPAGQRVTVLLSGDGVPVGGSGVVDGRGRVPDGVGFWVGVQTFNEVPVVVEQVIVRSDEAADPAVPDGIGWTSGSSLLAARWVTSVVGNENLAEQLVVVNPAPEGIARVSLSVIRDGAVVGTPTEVEVPARQRLVVDVGELAGAFASVLVVESTEPVAVERVVTGRSAGVMSVSAAVPVHGTEVAPGLRPFD